VVDNRPSARDSSPRQNEDLTLISDIYTNKGQILSQTVKDEMLAWETIKWDVAETGQCRKWQEDLPLNDASLCLQCHQEELEEKAKIQWEAIKREQRKKDERYYDTPLLEHCYCPPSCLAVNEDQEPIPKTFMSLLMRRYGWQSYLIQKIRSDCRRTRVNTDTHALMDTVQLRNEVKSLEKAMISLIGWDDVSMYDALLLLGRNLQSHGSRPSVPTYF
jgi:hypothetical protein